MGEVPVVVPEPHRFVTPTFFGSGCMLELLGQVF